MLISQNPATGQQLYAYAPHDARTLNALVNAVAERQERWRHVSFDQRRKMMLALASLLEQRVTSLARLITDEMGKIIGESQAEIHKCAWVCRYYATEAESMLSDEPLESDGRQAMAVFEPLGVVLAIMPWNFPFWQVFRFAAPAVMAGNAVVLKHASNVSGCSLAIEALFLEAGFPKNLFRSALVGSEAIAPLIDHPAIQAITLTGSEKAGSAVAGLAGKAIKKCVLELGGMDIFWVRSDADVPKAVATAIQARFLNAGQSCIAAKRFLVDERVYEPFVVGVARLLSAFRVGDPHQAETQMGPLAQERFVAELQDQVERSKAKGAEVFMGGRPIEGPGAFFQPTILVNIQPHMPVFQEEVFGPVMPIMKIRGDQEALDVANHCPYGLGGSLWTQDIETGIALARQVETGSVFVNGMTKSDPRLPFGGVKKSGYGRELSHYGIKEFVNIKTIWVGQ
jgi:succinate-semialdehyde dehydrogenase/glutarate-semialdehyde dehydrogenase